MKILSRKAIENIASTIITQYEDTHHEPHGIIHRIDPVRIAEDMFGLTVDYYKLSKSGTILGITSYEDYGIGIYQDDNSPGFYYLDGKTILIDKTLKDNEEQLGRLNFTIAHETSHQIYKTLYPAEYGVRYRTSPVYYYRETTVAKPGITDWSEWQANALASALLLPSELLKRCLFFFELGEKIRMLNRVYSPADYVRFTNMAAFLQVSKKALTIRLKQLGLLELDYLDDPYALVDVVKEDDND